MTQRKPWSKAARAAQSKRMKAFWAGRKAKTRPWYQTLWERVKGAL